MIKQILFFVCLSNIYLHSMGVLSNQEQQFIHAVFSGALIRVGLIDLRKQDPVVYETFKKAYKGESFEKNQDACAVLKTKKLFDGNNQVSFEVRKFLVETQFDFNEIESKS